MLVTARDIVLRVPDADEARIRHELAGNLCRCTGYAGIVRAIRRVLGEAPPPPPAPAAPPTSRIAPLPQPPSDTSPSPAPAGPSLDLVLRIARPRAEVWTALHDPALMAGCVPGASLTTIGNERIEGEMRVALGPITAVFAGSARLHFDETVTQHRSPARPGTSAPARGSRARRRSASPTPAPQRPRPTSRSPTRSPDPSHSSRAGRSSPRSLPRSPKPSPALSSAGSGASAPRRRASPPSRCSRAHCGGSFAGCSACHERTRGRLPNTDAAARLPDPPAAPDPPRAVRRGMRRLRRDPRAIQHHDRHRRPARARSGTPRRGNRGGPRQRSPTCSPGWRRAASSRAGGRAPTNA